MQILHQLHDLYQEPRDRISPWLRRRVQLGLDFNDPRLNPNGGAIAVGHPLGASGARLALAAMRQLERTGGRYALVSLCIGLGQGIACIIERLD
nr:K537 [uncultured bacterium]